MKEVWFEDKELDQNLNSGFLSGDVKTVRTLFSQTVQTVLFKGKETTLEKLWFFFSGVCKDRRELCFPRLIRQKEWMKKVWFEDKQTTLEPKLWFPFWGL